MVLAFERSKSRDCMLRLCRTSSRGDLLNSCQGSLHDKLAFNEQCPQNVVPRMLLHPQWQSWPLLQAAPFLILAFFSFMISSLSLLLYVIISHLARVRYGNLSRQQPKDMLEH